MNEWEWQLLEDKTRVDQLVIAGREVKTGDRVRLRPRPGGDVLDIALAGQIAIIESIEQDYEGKNHICVVLDDDPGRDLGFMRQPGHRFFFDAEEAEPLPPGVEPQRRETLPAGVLVACIGNIFFGDDGFGVEVAKRLSTFDIPEGVRIVDFGIRGFDLACALQENYDAVILVDAYPHGKAPGTISLVEPDLSKLGVPDAAVAEGHGMNPLNVLRMATAMSGPLNEKILLVGCEPGNLGGDEGMMGLSDPVAGAVDGAARMIVSLSEKILREREERRS